MAIARGEVSGTLKVNGLSAERDLVAISYHKQAVGSSTQRVVVGETRSAADGSYTLEMPGFADPVIVLALDDYGDTWEPDVALALDDKIMPTAGKENGYVYKVTAAGNSGGYEPSWIIPSGGIDTMSVGTATVQAVPVWRSMVHAPVTPRAIEFWTPAEIATALWLDASDASSLVMSGSRATTIKDKSGNGRDFTEASSGSGATVVSAAQNGLPVLRGDGTNTSMKTSGPIISGSADRTVFVVGVHGSTAAPDTIITLGWDTGSSAGSVFQITPEIGVRVRSGSRIFNQSASISDAQIITTTSENGNTTGINAWLNGGQLSASSTSSRALNTSGDTTLLYKNLAVRTEHASADMCEIVVASGVLSTADREKIEGYLAWKWGLQGGLPAGHAHKSAAPLKT